jgi:hypothetical protein
MSFKKAFAVVVISAATIYGAYTASKKYIVEPCARQQERKQIETSIESRVGYLEGLLNQVSKENYDYFRNKLGSDQTFVDSMVRKAVSNDPNYVISLLPENKMVEYVNSNYNLLNQENKKEVALIYAKEEIDRVKKDVDNFFDNTYEKAKNLEEKSGGRLRNLKTKINEKIREIIHQDG